MFELFKSTGKKVCPPNHVRKSNCPLIVRSTSEDLLTANVFGILKNLDPKIWLSRLLGEAIKGKDFSNHTFENLSVEFWKKYRPPANRKYKEGLSEVDVTITYNGGVIFIEAKYLAPLSLRTTHDRHRDQIIRYLDLGANHYLNHPDGVQEFYFILIVDTEEPPWILSRYRLSENIRKGLTHSGLFGTYGDVTAILSKGIGWLSWSQLKRILEAARDQFRAETELRFVDDVIRYLGYKIRQGDRIKNERKQMALW